MKLARRLDCSIVQAGWAFQGSTLEAQYDAVWKQAVDSLREVGKLAFTHGVCIVIEFACRQNAKLVNTMDDALRMLDEVNSENILVMADTFHIHAEEDSFSETVLKAGKRLGYVHLSDNDRLAPGTGKIDFEEFIKALKKISYEGYMVMEFDTYPSPDEALKQAAKYMKKILSK